MKKTVNSCKIGGSIFRQICVKNCCKREIRHESRRNDRLSIIVREYFIERSENPYWLGTQLVGESLELPVIRWSMSSVPWANHILLVQLTSVGPLRSPTQSTNPPTHQAHH